MTKSTSDRQSNCKSTSERQSNLLFVCSILTCTNYRVVSWFLRGLVVLAWSRESSRYAAVTRPVEIDAGQRTQPFRGAHVPRGKPVLVSELMYDSERGFEIRYYFFYPEGKYCAAVAVQRSKYIEICIYTNKQCTSKIVRVRVILTQK